MLDGLPVVPFIIGNGTLGIASRHLPGFEEGLYLLDWDGGNVVFEAGPKGDDLDAFLNEVLPISTA
jgi:hypothetical protein